MNEISAKVTGSTSVLIKTVGEGHSLNEELIAVNWFDTRTEWLYHLYNSLASRSVKKIGGLPLFKAKVAKDISDDKFRRDIILIVQYPSGNAFKNLIESNYFKIVSLLRVKAVNRFTFSFTKAVINPKFEKKYAFYAIHNYSSRMAKEVILDNIKEVEQGNISVLYNGYTFAHLSKVIKGQSPEDIEYIVDNVIVYGGDNEEQLTQFLNSASYKAHFGTQQNEYKGLLNRIF